MFGSEGTPIDNRIVRSLVVLVGLVLLGVATRFVSQWYLESLSKSGLSAEQLILKLQNTIFLTFLVAAVAVAIVFYLRITLHLRTRELAAEVNQDISFSREQFKQFYEMSPVPYLLVTPVGIIDRPNKAALRFFGATPEVLIGSPFIPRILESEDRSFVDILPERLQRRVPVERVELRVQAAGGVARWVLFSVSFLRTEHSKYHVGLVTLVDITEQKELDRMKTEFTSLASHQLRSPLSTVRWYIDFLRARHMDKLPPVVVEYLGYMYERNQQMIDIVNTLLNLSRIEMGRIKVDKAKVDIGTVVRDVVRELSNNAEVNGVVMHIDLGGDTQLTTDAALLRIVLQNLVSNAVRYTKEGGTVTIHGIQQHERYSISVIDTGVGIPLGEQPKIFEKLYRATNAKQLRTDGNGLGLYMSKALTDALGGSLSFTSAEGRGTTFTLELPLW